MKVFVIDSKLRKHSVDVDDSATVAHVKLLLASMSLVPAGLVPKLVYQKRMLRDDECVGSIGYSPERCLSLVCVKATPASTAADPIPLHAPLFSWRLEAQLAQERTGFYAGSRFLGARRLKGEI